MTNVSQNDMSRQVQMGMPLNSQTSAREVIQTDQGLISKDRVRAMQQQHLAPDAPTIKNISTNQSQEYFALATQTGFEII